MSLQSPGLVAFECASPESHKKPHSLIFIGGLCDGLYTVPYLQDLAKALEPTEWSLFSIVLSSSYMQWGMGRIGKDVEEIGKCVEHVTKYKESTRTGDAEPVKVAIMGHSTGSQDVLSYLYLPNPLPVDPVFDVGLLHTTRPTVNGAILQAAVSDREVVSESHSNGDADAQAAERRATYIQLVDMAKRVTYADENTQDVLLPLSLTSKLGFPATPLSARRFLSLVSPDSPENPQEDDLFSSDLTEKRLQETFGMISTRAILQTRLLVLYSGADQFAPPWVDKEKLLQRWRAATDKSIEKVWDDEYSGVVPGASHALGGPEESDARRDLVTRVVDYLTRIVQPS
jgi:hypothetical protein